MGAYELVELLGEGGMGAVYRAVHHPSGRAVAVKTLHRYLKADDRRRRLLLDEATAAAKLDDPRIVRLLDLGREDDGAPFLVMELAEGVPLDRMISAWAGWERIANALASTLEGLAAAHARGIVHRDLKPSNVVVAPDGTARVLDFGVAALIDPLARRKRKADLVVGTPEFMPPEQLTGQGAIGPWTDLYAFGVMLADVVRGRSPFARAASMVALMLAKESHVPEPLPAVRPGLEVPSELQDLIESLIRPHHRARPRFAVDVARELRRLAARVTDRVAEIPAPIESYDSARPTTIDPGSGTPGSSGGFSSDEISVVELLELPAFLPAADPDPALGASLSRLRDVPLVGRRHEREELERAISEVVSERAPRLVLYVGEPGIGKSRLARWGLSLVEREGLMEGTAGGYDPSGADVAGGLRQALRRLVGAPGKKPERTWGWIGEPELEPSELARYLGDEDRTTLLPVETILRLARGVLRGVGRITPVYLWLDDLAWARDGALQLAQQLLDEGDAPVLVVATMRGGAAQHPLVRERIRRLADHPRATRRQLGVLDAEARAQLIREVAPVEEGLARELAARVDGSPLLLVQLVQDWLSRGLLEPRGDAYGTSGETSLDELLVARPLASLVDDRVDATLATFPQGEAVEVLGRAALLGARFEHRALGAACAKRRELVASLDGVLDHALLVGLLRADRSGVYSFDHGLVHEALVSRIEAGASRDEALLDAANGLVSRYGKDRADVAGMVGELLWRAGQRDRAWDRLLHAVGRAAWGSDALGARRHLAVARDWLREDPSRRADVEHAEARAAYYALRYEDALAALARAREAATSGLELARFDATEAEVLFYMDRFAEARALAERCVAAAAGSEDPDVLAIAAEAEHRLADLASIRGDLDLELRHRERCLELHVAAANPWRARVARFNVAEVLAALGRAEEALALQERAAEETRRAKDEMFLAYARESRAHVLALLGRAGEAREAIEESRQSALASGDEWRLTMASAFSALLAAEQDDDETTLRETRAFLEAYRKIPQDETSTVTAMLRLAARLEVRGFADLAREVDGLLERRAERARAGFGEG